MIKQLQLTEVKQKRIVDWLCEEIEGANGALALRSDKERKWEIWNKNFQEMPEKDIKDFPYERASNIVAPIHNIAVNAFVGRQYNTFFSTPTLWSVEALNADWADHAMPTERLLDYAQRFEMNVRKHSISWLYDIANTGLGIIKIPWISEQKQGKRYDEKGDIVAYEGEQIDGPRFIPIPRYDAIYPITSEKDIQKMRWFDHRFRLRWGIIEHRGRLGTYSNTDAVKGHITDTYKINSIISEEERLRAEIRAFDLEEYTFDEVWCFYDYDGDGIEEHCVFTLNFDSKQLVRAILNPFNHGKRPFIATPCFPCAHSLEGIGFGQKLERLQEGLTTVINQAIDNATLANTRGYKARRGSGIKPGTTIYPGKVFLLDDISDMEAFAMADIYPSSRMVFDMIVGISERSTGVADYNLGRESSVAGSAATATSTLALIQEGSKLFDFLLKCERSDMSEIAYQVYALYAQFKPRGLVFSLLGDDAQYIEHTWEARPGDITRCLQFELSATSPHVSKELEKESWLSLFNLIMGYYDKVFQVAQIMTDPEAQPQLKLIAAKMVIKGHEVMERVIERWGLADASRMLIDPKEIENLAKSQTEEGGLTNATGGGQVVPGGVGRPTGLNNPPRMAGLSSFIGGRG